MLLKVEEVLIMDNQKGDEVSVYKKKSPANKQNAFSALSDSMRSLASKLGKYDLTPTLSSGLGLLDLLAHYYILNAFVVDMDWAPSIGTIFTVASFMREFKLDRGHKSLIRTLLVRLEGPGGFLTRTKSESAPATQKNGLSVHEWTVTDYPPTPCEIRQQIKDLQTELLRYPECGVEIKFLSYVANQLYSCLRGRTSSLSLLFPSADSLNFKFGATALYENSIIMKHAKVAYMEEALLQIVQGAPKTIRILEIGAGTGGTTLPVLQKLTNNTSARISYTFTDISSFFVSKAKPRFEQTFPHQVDFEFKLLDIEMDPTEQGFAAGDYDVVLVADVFHATQYLDDTIRHTRRLLAPGGILILGEIFHSDQFIECTFGLTEGWWRFADERKDGPLISSEGWSGLLMGGGFVSTCVVGDGTYGVVFALADGVN